jgi:hypothetical protein
MSERNTIISIVVLFLALILPKLGLSVTQTEIEGTVMSAIQVITTILTWIGFNKATNRTIGGLKRK